MRPREGVLGVARAFVTALALSAAGSWAPGGAVALAGEALPAEGVFAAAATAPVVADGTPVDVVFVALGPDGRPLPGVVAKAVASAGAAEGWTEVAPGVYRTTWRATGLPTSKVTVTAKGRNPATKAALTATATLEVVAAGPALEARVSPEGLTLGKDEGATVTLLGADARTLRVRASTGTVGAAEARAGGATSLAYTPSSEKPPRLALITFADGAAPGRTGSVVLPLSGAIDFPVTGRQGDQVALEIAGRRFGPVPIGSDGKGRVPVVVPPGVGTGTKITLRDGSQIKEPQDLKIPETRRIALFPLPPVVPAGATFPVRVLVVRADGAPDETAPTLSADGAQVGTVRSLGDGVFEADVTVGEGAVSVVASLGSEVQTDTLEVTAGEVSAGPAVGVLLAPERGALANDGADHVDVVVAAVDAFGLPVPGVPVALVATGGSLSAAQVVTGPEGTARVTVTAGASAGLLDVVATGGVGGGAVSLLQAPDPSVLGGLVLPPTGARSEVARAWREDVRWEPVATPGAVARVTLSVEGAVAPGATVTLVASALDDAGQPIPGAEPEIVASAGTLSPPEVADDGAVRRTLVLPEDLGAGVELVASVGERQATATLGGDAVAGDPWAPAAEPVPEPVVEPVVEPEPEPEAADARWLRARGSLLGGTYRYEQAPSADPEPLLPSRLAVGGEAGPPATPLGGELDLRAWGDGLDLPWIGVHGQLRAAAYRIESDLFSDPADDTLVNVELDALARYPFAVGGDQYWVGAKGGFHANDFLLFEGCLEAGCDVTYAPRTVTGLGVGAEIGADVQRMFLVAGYTLGLAQATQPYANAVDLDLGYEVMDRLFVDVGFTSLTRSVVLRGADSGLDRGTLTDANMIFKLGLGYAL